MLQYWYLDVTIDRAMKVERVTTLLNVDDYELMQSRLALLEGIARGERAITEEKLLSHYDAKEQMSKWLND